MSTNTKTMENSSDEDDWDNVEEVEENDIMHAKEDVQVDADAFGPRKKTEKEKEKEWIMTMMKRLVKQTKQNIQIYQHQVHLLCLLASSQFINQMCNDEYLQSLCLSTLPSDVILQQNYSAQHIKNLLLHLVSTYLRPAQLDDNPTSLKSLSAKADILADIITDKQCAKTYLEVVMIFVVALRSLGVRTRLVCSLHPVSYKLPTKKQLEVKQQTLKVKKEKLIAKGVQIPTKKIAQLDGCDDDEDDDESNFKSVGVRTTRSRAKKRSRPNGAGGLKREDKAEEKSKESPAKKISKMMRSSCEKVEKGKKPRRLSAAVALKKLKQEEEEAEGKTETKRKRKIKSEDKPETSRKKMKKQLEDEDFEVKKEEAKGKKKTTKTTTTKKVKSKGMDQWIEIFISEMGGWTCYDPIHHTLGNPAGIEAQATAPLHYVIGLEGERVVRDVTARYASGWMTSTRKLRIGHVTKGWWADTLEPYKTKDKREENEENSQIERILLSHPRPTSIQAYKDHPLFALRRHLLKYEAVYPADVEVVGLVRGEEILPRSSVRILHTRDKWLQQALTVRDGEVPYKMVASFLMNKKDKKPSDERNLPLFGEWQTEPYQPPTARDGIVPRNRYGNVDLFKPCMLPKGCVWLHLANVQSVARKLNIDCVPAVIGFDSHNCFSHPVQDGHVVCAEHEQVLRDAWREDQRHAAERKRVKLEGEVYGRWKKLIRGVLVKERVRVKYGGGEQQQQQQHTEKSWQNDKLQLLHEQEEHEECKKTRGRKKTTAKKSAALPPQKTETLED